MAEPLPPLPPLPPDLGVSSGRWTVREWLSERILFGLMIIGGYLLMVLGGSAVLHALKVASGDPAASLLHDGSTTLGPLVGVIVYAIWKLDKVDKQNADSLAKMAQSSTTGDGK